MAKRKQESTQRRKGSDITAQLENNPRFPLIYAAATLLFTIILFGKFVFSGSNMMLFGSDTIQAGVYFRDYLVSFFKEHGSIPPWNPYIFCGMPYVDAFHGDIFYLPTFILKMILPLPKALGWGLVLHIYLAGLFAYQCARGFGLSRLASSFAGISYMFSGYLVSLVAPGHDGKIFVTTLFPLAFHLLNRGTLTFQLKYFVGLGLTIAFIILTPHPQMSYFALWGLGFFLLYRLVFHFIEKKPFAKAALVIVMFGLAVIIGLLGSAIQFYPGYRYIQEFSPRAGEGAEGRGGYEWATSWSMHLEEAAGQIIPFFPGVDDRKAEGGYWGRNAFKDNTEYAGFFPIFLGIIGLTLWRRREMWFLLGLAVFALLYALGDTTPLFRIFYELIPNVKKLRAPSMIMFLFSFSVCLLAAFGIDALARLRQEKHHKITDRLNFYLLLVAGILSVKTLLITVAGESLMSLYTSILYTSIRPENQQAMLSTLATIQTSFWLITVLTWLAVFVIRGFVTGRQGRLALVVLIFVSLVDLWRVDLRFIDVVEYSRYFPDAPVLRMLRAEPEPFRIMDFTRQSFSSKDYFALHRVEQTVGYHGAQLKTFDEFIGGLAYSNLIDERGINQRPFQMTNTKYIILDRGIGLPKEEGFLRVYDNEVAVYQIPDIMRRAEIFHQYVLGSEGKEDVDRLLAADFPFRERLLLYERPEFEPEEPDTLMQEGVQILEHHPDRQRYRVSLAAAGLLFISDNYFPAWKARVNGVESKILKANHTFRAISLPAGENDVELYWDWPRYRNSRNITVITFITSLLLLGACIIIQRRHPGEST